MTHTEIMTNPEIIKPELESQILNALPSIKIDNTIIHTDVIASAIDWTKSAKISDKKIKNIVDVLIKSFINKLKETPKAIIQRIEICGYDYQRRYGIAIQIYLDFNK